LAHDVNPVDEVRSHDVDTFVAVSAKRNINVALLIVLPASGSKVWKSLISKVVGSAHWRGVRGTVNATGRRARRKRLDNILDGLFGLSLFSLFFFG